MLDSRLYRAAFVPALLILLIVAFSLTVRPRPIGTTLSPDTFFADRAMETLDRLATAFPTRRPGSEADRRLAANIAAELRRSVPGTVREESFEGKTIDGKQQLINVVASRPGEPGPSIVVVAHRDAIESGSRAELSGTAALLELARVAGAGRLRRTITFISTSGGSGGFAGAVEAASRIDRPVDAVIVLGAVGSAGQYRPMVVGNSNGLGQAPLQLQRTMQAALEREAKMVTATPRAFIQGLRMAAPMTLGEQGPFVRAGLPAVLISPTGERPPASDAVVSTQRMEGFGRAVLAALYALDNGPDISGKGPTNDLVLRGKVIPGWAIRLLIFGFLLPPFLVAVDAAARLRRRREPVGPWLAWALVPALPLIAACSVAVALSRSGLISVSPKAPLVPDAITYSGDVIAAIVVLMLVTALAWIGLRPAILRAVGLDPAIRPDRAGAGVATALAFTSITMLLWLANPYAAGAVVPAAHLWLWAIAPESRLRRSVAAVLVLLGVALPLVVVVVLAQVFALPALKLPWFWILLVAGGHAPWWTWMLWSLIVGVGISVVTIVARRSPTQVAAPPITVRGPASYAGPGSLGGTTSARGR